MRTGVTHLIKNALTELLPKKPLLPLMLLQRVVTHQRVEMLHLQMLHLHEDELQLTQSEAIKPINDR
jgi:hypothetical protein